MLDRDGAVLAPAKLAQTLQKGGSISALISGLVGPRYPMVGSFAVGRCALAANGHAAAPPSSVMNSRRFTINASRASDRKDSTL
jgi:hypothetical protein